MYEVSDSATSVKRRVTLDDVAKVAHVATSTASRALNRPGRINAETEALVRQVATDLGYERPENFWLRTHSVTQKIGVTIVPEKYRLLAAIQEKLYAEHYLPVLYSAVPVQALRIIKQEFDNVDGLIVDNPEIPGRFRLEIPSTQPLVVTNCLIDEATCVIPDTEQGVAVMLTHLRSLRHQSIAYFYAKDSWLDESVLQALRSGCEQTGLTLHGDVYKRQLQTRTTTLEVPDRKIGVEAVRQLVSQIRHRSRCENRVKHVNMRLVNGDTTGFF